jgi:hypothetical protein
MNLKPTTVYVPVSVEDNNPKDCKDKFVILKEGKGVCSFIGNKSGGMWEGWNVRSKGELTHWLKETQSILLTEEQLLELKKKWMEEAWDACKMRMDETKDYQFCKKDEYRTKDKQSFLNSIKL